MQGTIQPVALDRLEDRADIRLPSAWISSAKQGSIVEDGTWITSGAVSLPPAEDGAALVLLGRDMEHAYEGLLELGSSGARIYVLVGPDWGQQEEDVERILRMPFVFVRRVPEVPVSGVHSGNVVQLCLGGDLVIQLDDNQSEALRLTFLRLFWHEATEEAWSGGQQFEWRPVRERPFDVPLAQALAPVRLEHSDARLLGEVEGALMHLASGDLPEDAPKRLWFPAGPENHDRLSTLTQAGAEVLWEDRGLPDLLIGADSGDVLFSGSSSRLRLRLTADQAHELAQVLEEDASWHFNCNIHLGDPSHQGAEFWLPGEVDAHCLQLEQVIDLRDQNATSLNAVADTFPEDFPQAQPLALSVRYQWTVIPPTLPRGTEDDALVGRWRKLDGNWSSRINDVRKLLAASKDDRGRIGKVLSQLVGAMLGFKLTHDELLKNASGLEDKLPSTVGPDHAVELFRQLSEIEDQSRKLQTDLKEAERKAREDDEREKQKAVWSTRVEAAKHELLGLRAELEEIQGSRNLVEKNCQDADEQFKSADKAAKKDIKVRKSKLSDDLQRLEKKIKQLKGEIEAKETLAVEVFEFNPSKQPRQRKEKTGGRFVPEQSGTKRTIVPEEALPVVGRLMRKTGSASDRPRYLVIDKWKDLDDGEREAKRLNALLVAPETI